MCLINIKHVKNIATYRIEGYSCAFSLFFFSVLRSVNRFAGPSESLPDCSGSCNLHMILGNCSHHTSLRFTASHHSIHTTPGQHIQQAAHHTWSMLTLLFANIHTRTGNCSFHTWGTNRVKHTARGLKQACLTDFENKIIHKHFMLKECFIMFFHWMWRFVLCTFLGENQGEKDGLYVINR